MENPYIPKGIDKDQKFLGKEVAYYEGIFRLWLKIMEKIAAGEDVTNLVNHLEASFPYKDTEYNKKIEEARKEMQDQANKRDRFGRPDPSASRSAATNFTLRKYRLLMDLFKRRRVLPQEAEEEEF